MKKLHCLTAMADFFESSVQFTKGWGWGWFSQAVKFFCLSVVWSWLLTEVEHSYNQI